MKDNLTLTDIRYMCNSGILVHNIDLYNIELPAPALFILDGT